jgi:hypothetical protein
MSEENVLFRVTRENTSIFHPDRAVSVLPVETGGEIELPRSVAEYHVKNGVGEILAEVAEETPETPETPENAPKRRGRPAAAPSA